MPNLVRRCSALPKLNGSHESPLQACRSTASDAGGGVHTKSGARVQTSIGSRCRSSRQVARGSQFIRLRPSHVAPRQRLAHGYRRLHLKLSTQRTDERTLNVPMQHPRAHPGRASANRNPGLLVAKSKTAHRCPILRCVSGTTGCTTYSANER